MFGWVRRFVLVLIGVILVPLVLTPIYWLVSPVSVPMVARLVTGQQMIREWRAIDQVSDRLKASVLMSEDGQFCRHWGVDLGALRAEFNIWREGGSPRGASTITMQVARNLFLWNGRSYLRKVLEVPLAVYLDLVLSKRRIFEIYLNIAEWGPSGQFGIEAGAQEAFDKNADAFTWREASLLAVTLPNPHLRKPARPTRGMVRVAGIVERRAKGAQTHISCLYGANGPDLS